MFKKTKKLKIKWVIIGLILTLLIFPLTKIYGEEVNWFWDMDKATCLAPAPWNKNGPPAYIDGAEDIKFQDSILSYRHKTGHCWFWLNFEGKEMDASKFHILSFRVFFAQSGKITLYYSSTAEETALLDTDITVIEGWQEYKIDLGKYTFGKRYFVDKQGTNQYSKWGGKEGKIIGIRFDTFAPAGSVIKWDWIKITSSDENTTTFLKETSNLVVNSSFEITTNPQLPDGWSDGGWGIKDACWLKDIEKWKNAFSIDRNEFYDGHQSLRITNFENYPDISLYSCWIDIPAFLSNNTWSFSAFLKSKTDGQKVTFQILDSSYREKVEKDFIVDTEWKRYSFTTPIEVNPVVLKFVFDKGTYWIDAIQLENSPNPTEYVPSSYDKKLLSNIEENVISRGVYQITPNFSIPENRKINKTKIELKDRVLLINNNPFIPYTYSMQYSQDMNFFFKEIKKAGFNSVSFYVGSSEQIEEIKEKFVLAEESGLMVIPWLRCKTEELPQIIPILKKSPSLLAWLVIDEPIDPFSESVTERVSLVKKLDPEHPVYVNYRTNELRIFMDKLESLPGDIISGDEYPIANFKWPGNVSSPGNLVKEMEKSLVKSPKIVWYWLQITGYAFMILREPTPEEFEAMTYLTLINGAKGLLFFQNRPRSDNLWQKAGQIGREIAELTPILYSSNTLSDIISTPSEIKVLGKEYNSKKYIVAVNSSPKKIDAKFNLSLPKSNDIHDDVNVKVLFENRTLNFTDKNVLEDVFEGYQRHIYEISGE